MASDFSDSLNRRLAAELAQLDADTGPNKWSDVLQARQEKIDALSVMRDRRIKEQTIQQNSLAGRIGLDLNGWTASGVNLVDAAVQGGKSAIRSIGAAGNTLSGDLDDVVGYADAQKADAESGPLAVQQLKEEFARLRAQNPDQGIIESVRNVGGTMLDNKQGSVEFLAENLPNSVATLGSGWAGAKAGAALGSLAGPVGAAVGGTAGFLGGMFLGNSLLEGGSKAIEKAGDGSFTEAERADSIREGAVKGGVITAVDAATLGLGGKIAKTLNRGAIEAGARAEARVLAGAGVDVTNREAVKAALLDPALRTTARAAGQTAASQTSSLASRGATAGTLLATETVGEGVGEYLGEYAATGDANVFDAVVESAAGFTQSAPEAVFNLRRSQSNELNEKGIVAADLSIEDRLPNSSQTVNEAFSPAVKKASEEALQTGDISKLIDPASSIYSPSAAVAVLQQRALDPAMSDKVKTDSLIQAFEIINVANDKVVELLGFKNAIAEDAPEQKDIDQELDILRNEIVRAEESVKALSQELIPKDLNLNELAQTITADNPEQSQAAIRTIVNASMAAPERLEPEVAQRLAEDTANGLTESQRNYLRVFSETRQATNALKDLDSVSRDINQGDGENFRGLSEYLPLINTALQSNNAESAQNIVGQLERFAVSHQSKAEQVSLAYTEFLKDKKPRVVVRNEDLSWSVRLGEMSIEERSKTGSVNVDVKSVKLARTIPVEAKAITATLNQAQAALALVSSSVPSSTTTVTDTNVPEAAQTVESQTQGPQVPAAATATGTAPAASSAAVDALPGSGSTDAAGSATATVEAPGVSQPAQPTEPTRSAEATVATQPVQTEQAEISVSQSSGYGYAPRTRRNVSAADVSILIDRDGETDKTNKVQAEAKSARKPFLKLATGEGIQSFVSRVAYTLQKARGTVLNVSGSSIDRWANPTGKGQPRNEEQLADRMFDVLSGIKQRAPRLSTVVTGGQSGIDMAAAIAARALGLKVDVQMPKGFVQRAADGKERRLTQAQVLEQIEQGAVALRARKEARAVADQGSFAPSAGVETAAVVESDRSTEETSVELQSTGTAAETSTTAEADVSESEGTATQNDGVGLTVLRNREQYPKLGTGDRLGLVYRTLNKAANFLTQRRSKTDSEGNIAKERPLVELPNFLSRWLGGALDPTTLFGKSLIVPEQKALQSFQEFAERWGPIVRSNLIKGGRPNIKGKLPTPEFLFEDPLQDFFNSDGTLDENAVTAILYAAYTWISDSIAAPSVKSPEDILKMHGLDPENRDLYVTPEGYRALKNMSSFQDSAQDAIGRHAVNALGLQANSKATVEYLNRVRTAFGMHALLLLADEQVDLVDITTLDAGVVNQYIKGLDIPATSTSPAKTLKDGTVVKERDNYPLLTYISVRRGRGGKLSADGERIREANKASRGIVERLFSTEHSAVHASWEPLKFSQQFAKKTAQKIPKSLRRILEKAQSVEHRVIPEMWDLVSVLGDKVVLGAAGWRELDPARIQANNRDGVEATNASLENQLEGAKNLIEAAVSHSTLGLTQPFYVAMEVWRNFRVGISTRDLNPQGSKIHRFMFYRPEWESTFSLNDEQAVQKFLVAVAQSFGVKIDKQPNDETTADGGPLQQLIAKDNFRLRNVALRLAEMLEAQEQVRQGTLQALPDSVTLTAEEQQFISDFASANEGMQSLQGLVAYGKYELAKQQGNDAVTVRMLVGVDGKTNGPMLTMLALGAANSVKQLYETLNRGGFYQASDQVLNFNHWFKRPSSQDLYEDLSFAILDGIEITPALDAIYTFSGELVRDGKVTSAGRNLSKTPLTSFVFGSSINRSIEAMADAFLNDIYSRIEAVASGRDSTTTFEQLKSSLETLLTVGSETGSLDATSIDDLMQLVLRDAQKNVIRDNFKNVFGFRVEAAMREKFETYIDRRNSVNGAIQGAFNVYNAVYTDLRNQEIERLMEEGSIDFVVRDGKRIPTHGMTIEQDKAFRSRVAKLLPFANTAYTVGQDDIDAGLYMGKTRTSSSNELSHRVKVQLGRLVPSKNPRSWDVAHWDGQAMTSVEASPGVAGLPYFMHSLDSFLMHRSLENTDTLNVHDEAANGVDKTDRTAQAINGATFEGLLTFSPATEAYEMLVRAIENAVELAEQGTLSPKTLAEIGEGLRSVLPRPRKGQEPADIGDVPLLALEQMFDAQYKANKIRLGALAEAASIDQYTWEGGEYRVDDEARQKALEALAEHRQKATMDARLAQQAIRLGRYITEGADSTVQQEARNAVPAVARDDIENAFGALGTSSIQSDPRLVASFEENPVQTVSQVANLLMSANRMSRFNQRLLSQLVKTLSKISPNLRIQYVTRNTNPSTLLDVPTGPSRGWFIAKADGRVAIYVLSPDFANSGLTEETLLHEMVHAAVSVMIAKSSAAAKPLIKELKALHAQAKKYVAENGLTGYDAMLSNVDEFVAWGMTNTDLQDNVISRLQMRSTTASSPLVSGMQKFVRLLTELIFGKPEKNLENGMSVLINNVAGLLNEKNPAASAQVNVSQTTISSIDDEAALSMSPQGLIKAVTFKAKGIIVFNAAAKLTPRQMHALKLHELGVHYGLEKMVGTERFNEILSAIEKLKTSNAAVARAYRAVPASTKAQLVNEEALAYLVEQRANLPVILSLIQDIKTWFKKQFGIELTFEEDAYVLAKGAVAQYKGKVREITVPNLSTTPSDGFVQLNFDQALKAAPRMHQLLDSLVDALGDKIELTGSLAMSSSLKIFRHKSEQIHDLDFVYYGAWQELVADLKTKIPGHSLMRAFQAPDGSSFVISIAVPKRGVEILSVDGRFSNVVVTGRVNGGEVQALTTEHVDAVDFFVKDGAPTGKARNYVGKDGASRTVNLVDSNLTFDAKFSMARPKDFQDAVLAEVGGVMFSQTSDETVVNRSQATDPGVDEASNYRTEQIFDALDEGQVTPAFKAQLQGLLSGIVSALHGPFRAYANQISQSLSGDPMGIWTQALATGNAPFAQQLLKGGFAASAQELFVIEQVEATVKAALDRKEVTTSTLYRELEKLYKEARKTLKPSDFASQADYDFIFNPQADSEGRSDYLSKFAALGLANERFNKLLGFETQVDTKRFLEGNTVAQKLQNLFEKILAFFVDKMFGVFQGQKADEKLESLVTQLVMNEAKKKHLLALQAARGTPLSTKINDKAKTLVEAARGKVFDAAGSRFIRENRLQVVRAAGGLATVVAGDRVDALIDTLRDMRNRQFNERDGFGMSLLTEFKGHNVLFQALLRGTKHLEQMRKKLITRFARVSLESFKDFKSFDRDQKKSITNVFLRTGLHHLTKQQNGYELADLEKLLGNKAAINAEIDKLVAQLPQALADVYVRQANALGHFKVTGIAKSSMLMLNGYLIARMADTVYEGRMTEKQAKDAEPTITKLVSLFSLLYTNQKDQQQAKEILRTENARTDGGNGVEMVLALHAKLEEEALKTLFNDNPALMIHGYTPDIVNPYTAVQAATEEEGTELKQLGWKQLYQLPLDPADPQKEKRFLYSLNDGGLAPWQSGAVSTTSLKARGTHKSDGYMNVNTQGGLANAVLHSEINHAKAKAMEAIGREDSRMDLSQVAETNLVPTYNENGKVVNWRYLMAESTKDTIMERDNSFDQILGVLAGSSFDKVESKKQNNKVIEALREHYVSEARKNLNSFVEIGPESKDPELREIWRLLPESTKAAVRKHWGRDALKVPTDSVDILFGYRKYSLAEIFRKDPDARNRLEKMVVHVVDYLFYTYAKVVLKQPEDEARNYGKRAAVVFARAENAWQEIVREFKDIVVVRTGVVLLGNIFSNMSLLVAQGVPLRSILKDHLVAIRGAMAYQRDTERLGELGLQVSTGTISASDVEVQREMAELRNAIARNPVKRLMDEGLMPSIVEDVSANNDPYSYKSLFARKTEKYTSKLNPLVRTVAKNIYMTKDTWPYQTLSQITQLSDFVGRYTLYQHLTSRTDNPRSHADAVQESSEAFVNYDIAMHKALQYADDMGFVPFTKYFLRIQRVLLKMFQENPARVLTLALMNNYLDLGQTVLDSSFIHRLGNWPIQGGAFEYPFVLDDLATVEAAMKLVK